MSNNHLSMSNNQMFYIYRLRRMISGKEVVGLPSIQRDGLLVEADSDEERETLRQKLYRYRGVLGGLAVCAAMGYLGWFAGMLG